MKLFEVTYKGENSKPTTKKVISCDVPSLMDYLKQKIWVNTITLITEIEVDVFINKEGHND